MGKTTGAGNENGRGIVEENPTAWRSKHTTARASVVLGRAYAALYKDGREWFSWRMAPLRWQCLEEKENPGVAQRTAEGSREMRWRQWGQRGLAGHGGPVCIELSSGGVELLSFGRAPDSVVADFNRASRQDVLEKTVEEFVSGKRNASNLLSAIVAVSETDVAVVERFQTAVADGDAEDVAAQIVQNLFTAARRLTVNDPFLLPEG